MSSNIVLGYILYRGIIRMWVLIDRQPYMRKQGSYCQLGFSSEIEVPQLSSAWNFYTAQIELENSGMGSSLLYNL